MKKVTIVRNSMEIVTNVGWAQSFLDRLIGLMFKEEKDVASGLLIEPCKSIHTFFMKFSLDVAFLDSKNKVVRVIYGMRPWRMTRTYFTANTVLEVKAGLLPKDLNRGDQLEVVCTS